MSEPTPQKRKPSSGINKKPVRKRIKRQQAYDSGSSASGSDDEGAFISKDAPRTQKSKSSSKRATTKEFNGAKISRLTQSNATDQDGQEEPSESDEALASSDGAESSSEDDDAEDNEDSQRTRRPKTNRRNPDVFANSISTILSSKLPANKRQDPVLSKSKDAEEATQELADGKLEARAKRKLRDEKRLAKERGRVKDVLLGEPVLETNTGPGGTTTIRPATTAADVAEQEKRLRKTAQRGVVKLFNAVRAAQVRGEQASRAVREKGVIGHQQREEKVGEMGRQAFLDMVGGGGKMKPQSS